MGTTEAEREAPDRAMVVRTSITRRFHGGDKVVDTSTLFEGRRKGAKKAREDRKSSVTRQGTGSGVGTKGGRDWVGGDTSIHRRGSRKI